MKAQTIYKVPQGKLLKIFLTYENNKIESIQISGDFFAYPEEAIQLLEDFLKMTPINKDDLLDKITTFIEDHNVQFIGISGESITEAIMRCVHD